MLQYIKSRTSTDIYKYVRSNKPKVKFISQLAKNLKHTSKNDSIPLSQDVFIVKNNIIKDNTKAVLGKVSTHSTSYETKKF